VKTGELLQRPLLAFLYHVGVELARDAELKLFGKVVFLVAGRLLHSLKIQPEIATFLNK
jgi:hypothetical protein